MGGPVLGVDNALYTELLQAYVNDGHVDYARLCEDERLDRYLEELSATDPEAFASEEDRLAFWINAYNAFTLKIICDNYPLESINELHFGGLIAGSILNKTVWDKKFIVINGETMSLNHIEHDIVRPVFEDPRAHFALVCASKSCPALRPEAYEGDRLNAQLDDQGRVFIASPDKNYFETDRRVAHISKIFDWFKKDFGKNDEERLLFIARFAAEDVASSIRTDPGAWGRVWKLSSVPSTLTETPVAVSPSTSTTSPLWKSRPVRYTRSTPIVRTYCGRRSEMRGGGGKW